MIELVPPRIPAIVPGSQSQSFGEDFMIRVMFFAYETAGHQALFTKRHPEGKGNRPGLILWLIGTSLELWTFGNGDREWSVARTGRGWIQPGESQEVLAVRSGDRAWLIVKGIDRTHPGYIQASSGDVNCDAYCFLGTHIYDGKQHDDFTGRIKSVAVYDNACYKPAWVGRKSDWKEHRQRKTRVPLSRLLLPR